MRIKFDLSQNKSLRLCMWISEEFGVSRSPYLRRDTTSGNFIFEDFFEATELSSAPTVWCVDSIAFINTILRLRDSTVDDTMLLLGLDKGDETVKVSMTLVKMNDAGIPRATRIGVGDFETTGVKNLLLLAATVANEDYNTINRLMKALPLPPGLRYKVVVDHKMKSSVCGIAGGNPTHPCELCTYDRNRNDDYDEKTDNVVMRTFEQLRADNDAWRKAGASGKHQRQFNNVTNQPIEFLPQTGAVWDTLTLSALHLTINVVSRIANHGMTKSTKAVKSVMQPWLETDLSLKKFAQRDEWEGGKCVVIISERSIAKLQLRIDAATRASSTRLAASRTREIHPALRYLAALVAFRHVRTATFGDTVSDDAEKKVAEFRKSYLLLKLPVSRTVHVVLRHLVPFCRRYQSGLAPFVEEAHESLHRDFRLYHTRQHRSNTRHPDYCKFLLRAILTYNSLHSGAANSSSSAPSDPPEPPPPADAPDPADAPSESPPSQSPPAPRPLPPGAPPSAPPPSPPPTTSPNQQV